MKGNNNRLTSNNLIRLHPNEAGKQVVFGNQCFKGVSPDIFIALDLFNQSDSYVITRKLNITIKINPRLWSSQDFFRFLTQSQSGLDPFKTGALENTDKCNIHGDDETGLQVHPNLMALLRQEDLKQLKGPSWGFKVNKVSYLFHSIGVAANKDYAPVLPRNTSHFEIKFQRKKENDSPLNEYLCLNIHLMAETEESEKFNQIGVMARLNQCIRLFYTELGVLKQSVSPQTRLKDAMSITLDNFEAQGFSCIHGESLTVLAAHNHAKYYTVNNAHPRKSIQLSDFFSITARPAMPSDTVVIAKKSYSNVATSRLSSTSSSNDNKNNFWSNDKIFPSLTAATKTLFKP